MHGGDQQNPLRSVITEMKVKRPAIVACRYAGRTSMMVAFAAGFHVLQ